MAPRASATHLRSSSATTKSAVFGDAEYAYCGGERSESSDDHSSDDDDEAEAEGEAAVAGA